MGRYFCYAAMITLPILLLGCPLTFPPFDQPDDGSHDDKPHFSYSGLTGPANWGVLAEEWSACREGIEQSPVDIAGTTANAELPELVIDYHDTPAHLMNNGHTWQVNYETGSTLTYDGDTYDLLQFHFHAPSEHSIDGQRADAELHLVHSNSDGDLAVVGVLINAGAANTWLAEFWDDIPRSEGETELGYEINAEGGLPADRSYYTYPGSLTTPPCSEIVTWLVLKTPIEASQEQIDAMNNNLGDNARPLQSLNGRTIEEK